jgi:DNA-binding NtrC family response regulator
VLARLLVIDDEPAVGPVVEGFARQFGYDVEFRASAHDALASLAVLRPDVALVKAHMPELSGIDVLRSIQAVYPACQVILMTGKANVETAIEGIKGGAIDYLSRPFDFERLRRLLVGIRDRLMRRALAPASVAGTAHAGDFHGIIGRSAAMQQLFATIDRLAPYARTVLVTGETGTGKELVAKALHKAGRRRHRRFITVNCSAVVETLFESELFGHVRGAFTGATETKVGLFEHAGGSTLFLDEVGELPTGVQAKLLRAVEYGEIQRVGSLDTRKADVSVIAATNRDLRGEVAAGRFRADLFYRLSTLEVDIPPLRDRREDIPDLAAAFIRECAARFDRRIRGITAPAQRLLQQSAWHGNVRELRNVIERACIMTDGSLLTEDAVVAAMANAAPRAAAAPGRSDGVASGSADSSLSAAQRMQIRRVLEGTRGNKTAAARLLGVSRRSLYRWLDRLEIQA